MRSRRNYILGPHARQNLLVAQGETRRGKSLQRSTLSHRIPSIMNNRHDDIASALPADLDALPRLRWFRLRGMEMTRLETFIDAAFAFAISMLVIAAQQIP